MKQVLRGLPCTPEWPGVGVIEKQCLGGKNEWMEQEGVSKKGKTGQRLRQIGRVRAALEGREGWDRADARAKANRILIHRWKRKTPAGQQAIGDAKVVLGIVGQAQ